MNAKISVTCYRSKILSNGEAPLMVKITKNGKRSLKSLGISLNPKYWDFERDKPKSNCPNRMYIVSIITNALQKYQAIQLDMEAKNEDYTASEILADTASKTELITVENFLTSHIQQLRDNGKVGNSYAYLNLRTTLHNFHGKKLNFLFNAVAFCRFAVSLGSFSNTKWISRRCQLGCDVSGYTLEYDLSLVLSGQREFHTQSEVACSGGITAG